MPACQGGGAKRERAARRSGLLDEKPPDAAEFFLEYLRAGKDRAYAAASLRGVRAVAAQCGR